MFKVRMLSIRQWDDLDLKTHQVQRTALGEGRGLHSPWCSTGGGPGQFRPPPLLTCSSCPSRGKRQPPPTDHASPHGTRQECDSAAEPSRQTDVRAATSLRAASSVSTKSHAPPMQVKQAQSLKGFLRIVFVLKFPFTSKEIYDNMYSIKNKNTPPGIHHPV